MNRDCRTRRRCRRLLIISLLAGTAPVSADPAAECRQEVQEYAIPPEQAEDYIAGCIQSRGGLADPVSGEDDVPVDDAVAQPTAQPDDGVPGDSNGAY